MSNRKGRYYYPTGEDGLTGSYSDLPRPLQPGETMEMVLIDGTPGPYTPFDSPSRLQRN
jgi:hypothetical protein